MIERSSLELRAILAFYADAGVDTLLGDEPLDHLAADQALLPVEARQSGPAALDSPVGAATPRVAVRSASRAAGLADPRDAAAAPSPAVAVGTPPAADALLAPEAAVMAARDAARTAASLDELRSIMDGFKGCGLRATAKKLVFADGNPNARVMFVGEAPGRDEDIAGLPFVGRSGQMLDRMMAAIGLDRTSAYIANAVPWRPPGNRTPTPQESQICLPFLRRQIELANPDILVCVGGPSAQALLGFTDGIRRTRGRWQTYDTGTRQIRAIATFHPAYLLRSPLEKRLAWKDFLEIKQALAQSADVIRSAT